MRSPKEESSAYCSFRNTLLNLVDDAWDEYDYFRSETRKTVGWQVVGNMPILYFGDWQAYADSSPRIITVGYNPSKLEFSGIGRSRFPRNLRKSDSIEKYTRALNGYFHNRPYEEWFNHYEKLLAGLGATYGGKMNSATIRPYATSSVIHTDLCSPLATEPTWGKLPAKTKSALQKQGTCIWQSLVADCLKPNIILVSTAPSYMDREIAPLNRWKTFRTISRTSGHSPRRVPYHVKTCVVTFHGEKAVVIYGPLIRVPFNVFCSAEIGQQIKDNYQRLLSRPPLRTL